MIQRWCLVKEKASDKALALLSAISWQPRDTITLSDGEYVLGVAEFDDVGWAGVNTAQPGIILPSLSAPSSSLPSEIAALVAGLGVVLAPTDDIQQALRKLRTARSKSYLVDKPF